MGTQAKAYYIMFGGLEKPEGPADPNKLLPKNDVYSLRILNNATAEWSTRQCIGDLPMPRAYHSACRVGEDKMFIFGGCYTSNLRYNDVFFFKSCNIYLI